LPPAVDPYATPVKPRGSAAVPAKTPLSEETTRPLPVPAQPKSADAVSETTTSLTTTAPKPQANKRGRR
jgi:hypothetical protein